MYITVASIATAACLQFVTVTELVAVQLIAVQPSTSDSSELFAFMKPLKTQAAGE